MSEVCEELWCRLWVLGFDEVWFVWMSVLFDGNLCVWIEVG